MRAAAMAMYLNDVPVPTIMYLGRWRSDAFLQYILPQVEELSRDIATRMLGQPVFHLATPTATPLPTPIANTPHRGLGLSSLARPDPLRAHNTPPDRTNTPSTLTNPKH
jgi:hypothetical protein